MSPLVTASALLPRNILLYRPAPALMPMLHVKCWLPGAKERLLREPRAEREFRLFSRATLPRRFCRYFAPCHAPLDARLSRLRLF